MITVQNGKAVQVYKAKALTKEEVFAFYKPEIKPSIITWWWILRFISSRILVCIRKAVFLTESGEQNYSNYEEDVFSHIQTLRRFVILIIYQQENCIACNE